MENLVMQEQLSSYYSGKKVFVTGHTGFKGSWLTACLYFLGAKVKGYALEPEYKNGLFDLLEPFQIAESTIADIRNKDLLKKGIDSFQPDYIFHLAAQPLVRRSYKIPAETFEVNVVGTANLLEAVDSLSKKCTVIIITTDKVYQNKEQDILYNENDTLGGFDPYSASKACTELVINSFRNSFFNPVTYRNHEKVIASARAGNVIGGGDWNADRIIPDIVRSLQQQQTIEVRNPDAIRPWQHVLEPILGYLLLAGLMNNEPLKYSQAYNFGPLPGDHLTVKQLVETAISYWGNGNWKNISDATQPHETSLLKLDISLAKNELGWQPKINADQAIKRAIDWYKKPVDQQADFTFQQIKDYFDL
jgi:CDP-glucose 4,6-dehydratase